MDDLQQIRFREQIAKANYEIELKKIKLYEMSRHSYHDTSGAWYKMSSGQHELRKKILEAEINILLLDIEYLETKLSKQVV
jgi:hypothetical protein